jgi:hypothetical protein
VVDDSDVVCEDTVVVTLVSDTVDLLVQKLHERSQCPAYGQVKQKRTLHVSCGQGSPRRSADRLVQDSRQNVSFRSTCRHGVSETEDVPVVVVAVTVVWVPVVSVVAVCVTVEPVTDTVETVLVLLSVVVSVEVALTAQKPQVVSH